MSTTMKSQSSSFSVNAPLLNLSLLIALLAVSSPLLKACHKKQPDLHKHEHESISIGDQQITETLAYTVSAGVIGAAVLQGTYYWKRNASNISAVATASGKTSLIGSILQHGMFSLLGSLPVQFILIMFGAPVVLNKLKTYLLSLFVSTFIISPTLIEMDFLSILHSKRDKAWEEMLSHPVLYVNAAALLGLWLGVFVLPLDWDEWWQRWPLSCVYSSSIGYTVGVLFLRLKLKRIQAESYNNNGKAD
ncbi:GPI biosynthesis protein family Pig-F-domain-containing protein [Paraphysoderma sedebokerense]|nr:GPI biosynthesis protein family Pig-F-domain-containing protein [Paraphysoderma sedebokerense]